MGIKKDFQRRQAESRRREQEKRAQKGFGKKTFRNPDRIVRFTWWVAAFTFCLSIVGAIQAGAFIQSERAYLTAINFNFLDGLTPGKQLILLFQIRNSGKATAEPQNLSITTNQILPKPIEYDTLQEIALSPIVAGASDPHLYSGLNKDGTPFIMTDAFVKAVSSGAMKFYIYGFVEYEDDFSLFGPRRSTFCYLYLPTRSTPTNAAFGGCPIEQKQ